MKKILLIFAILCFCATIFVACSPLEKPQNLRIENDVLTWNTVDGATGYQVKLYSASYGKTANSVVKNVTANSFQIDIVGFGVYYNYYLQVRAVGIKNSVWSNSIKWNGEKEDENGLLFTFDDYFEPDGYDIAGGYYILWNANTNISNRFEIPSTHDDGVNGRLPVTTLANGVFKDCTELTEIIIPNTVIKIESGFYNCIKLAAITLPDSVVELGTAFKSTKIWADAPDNSVIYVCNWAVGYKGTLQTNLVLKSGTVGIVGGAFRDCTSITSVIIPEGVKRINYQTFWGCSLLEDVSIPNSVINIGNDAFGGYYNNDPNNDHHNPTHSSYSYMTKIWHNTPMNSVVYVDNWAVGFKGFEAPGTITIREGIVGLADDLFYREWQYSYFLLMNTNEIVLPSGLKYIGKDAFSIPDRFGAGDNNHFIKINVPASVVYIGYGAFSYWGWNGPTATINMQGRASADPNWNERWDIVCQARINWSA